MKRVKVFTVVFFAISAFVGSISFSPPKRLFQNYRFDPSLETLTLLRKRLIQTGQPISIIVTELASTSKWSTGLPGVSYVTSGIYLRAINFDVDAVADGGSDGQLTLQEAINAVADHYDNYGNLPNDGAYILVGVAQIVIRRSNVNTL